MKPDANSIGNFKLLIHYLIESTIKLAHYQTKQFHCVYELFEEVNIILEIDLNPFNLKYNITSLLN